MADVPMLVVYDNSSSERRISPSWTISRLKSRLETITGVPPSSQRLSVKTSGRGTTPVEAADEEGTTLEGFSLIPYAELHVTDTRPPGARPNYTDTSNVEKYVMPESEYEKKTDSVLAWKKAAKLGRFDPEAPQQQAAKVAAFRREAESRGIAVGLRCRVGGEDSRRGRVMYVGDVEEIPGGAGWWVGVRLDEPAGKNDGSIGGRRYWGEDEGEGKEVGGSGGGMKHGVFVRPERVEVGDWPPLDDFDGLDMEEI